MSAIESARSRFGWAAFLLSGPVLLAAAHAPERAWWLPSQLCFAAALCALWTLLGAGRLAALCCTLAGAALFLANLLQAAAVAVTGRAIDFAFWYHLNLDLLALASRAQRIELAAVALWLLAATAGFAFAFRPRRSVPTDRRARTGAAAALLIAAALLWLLPSPALALAAFGRRLARANDIARLDPEAAAARGVKLTSVGEAQLRWSGARRNLVLIYLESVESGFLDEERFPGLLPEIQALRREAICFDDLTPGANEAFTFGAVYSSLLGVPLIDAQLRGTLNQGLKVQVGSELLSVPKILHLAGYKQSFLVGHAPEFSGLNVLLDREGYDRVWSSITSDPTHGDWEHSGERWGISDRGLFERGLLEYEALAASGAPFNLTLMTIDTHAPAGRVEASGPAYDAWGAGDEKQLLTALHRTDRALGEFIARLKETPAWANTTVLITSDHLSWPCALDRVLKTAPRRRMNTFALNAGASGSRGGPSIPRPPSSSCSACRPTTASRSARACWARPTRIASTIRPSSASW